MNGQIRGLTSIRKGQGKDHLPFLVDTNSIKASENVSGGVQVENQGSLRKAIFTKPEGSHSGGVRLYPNRRGPNPEGSSFHKTGGVLIRRDLTFAKPEGSQSGGVSMLPIRRGPNFANPEGYCFLSTRRGIIFVKGLR